MFWVVLKLENCLKSCNLLLENKQIFTLKRFYEQYTNKKDINAIEQLFFIGYGNEQAGNPLFERYG